MRACFFCLWSESAKKERKDAPHWPACQSQRVFIADREFLGARGAGDGHARESHLVGAESPPHDGPKHVRDKAVSPICHRGRFAATTGQRCVRRYILASATASLAEPPAVRNTHDHDSLAEVDGAWRHRRQPMGGWDGRCLGLRSSVLLWRVLHGVRRRDLRAIRTSSAMAARASGLIAGGLRAAWSVRMGAGGVMGVVGGRA